MAKIVNFEQLAHRQEGKRRKKGGERLTFVAKGKTDRDKSTASKESVVEREKNFGFVDNRTRGLLLHSRALYSFTTTSALWDTLSIFGL